MMAFAPFRCGEQGKRSSSLHSSDAPAPITGAAFRCGAVGSRVWCNDCVYFGIRAPEGRARVAWSNKVIPPLGLNDRTRKQAIQERLPMPFRGLRHSTDSTQEYGACNRTGKGHQPLRPLSGTQSRSIHAKQ